MDYRTEVVEDEREVLDAVTIAAQRLWAAVCIVTTFSEEAADAHLAAKYGTWHERLERGIAALAGFYRAWYGEEYAALIGEYFEAKYASRNTTDKDHPAAIRFRNAKRQLFVLHDGYIVTGPELRKLGEPLVVDASSVHTFAAAPADVAALAAA